MFGGSISKWARSASRVSLRPKPSVPSTRYGLVIHGATRSGSVLIQSVATTIGPPSGPRTWATYGTRGALVRVEPVPALDAERLVAQQLERSRRVDLGRDAELLGEEVPGREHLLHDRAGAHEPDRALGAFLDRGRVGEPVDAA